MKRTIGQANEGELHTFLNKFRDEMEQKTQEEGVQDETVLDKQEKERKAFNDNAVETWQKKMKTMDQKKNTENILDEVTVRFNLASRERSGNFTPEAVKIFQDQQKRKKKKEGRNVQGFINTIAESIAQAQVDYLGEMSFAEVRATTRLGVSRALVDNEKTMKDAGLAPDDDVLDKPVYVVYTVTKTDTCPAMIDKFIFSDLEMFRANLVCIDRLTAGAEKTFYGPGDKDKLLADTTPEQRARINDEFFFLDTLTSKYGAGFDLRAPLGQSSSDYFDTLSKKRELELTKKEVFILNHLVKRLNE